MMVYQYVNKRPVGLKTQLCMHIFYSLEIIVLPVCFLHFVQDDRYIGIIIIHN